MMKKSKKIYCDILLVVGLIVFGTQSHAQTSYPQKYFRNPLNIPISLAGNFGECRPGHFHSGIDIKTEGRENLPVVAAADGYISRIKMEPGGFGHALYITHPNGFTTLYAHLNKFAPEVWNYVRQTQYANKKWTLDIQVPATKFPVKKGQEIAKSGNTGGSTAPHLHFEIRNTQNENPVNPLLFGFDINDNIAPIPLKLYVYNRNNLIYNTEPNYFVLNKAGGANYRVAKNDTVAFYDRTGIGLEVNDFMNGSTNTLAFYTAEWYIDGVLQGRIRLDDISYSVSRYVHAYADYATKFRKQDWVQCLFRLPGNQLTSIYEEISSDLGEIILPDNNAHPVSIILKDAAGNTSNIDFVAMRKVGSAASTQGQLINSKIVNKSPYSTARFELSPSHVYDDIKYTVSTSLMPNAFSLVHTVGIPQAPVHQYFDLSLQASSPVPFSLRNKMVMKYTDGKETSAKAAKSIENNGFYTASVRGFGQYYLAIDTTSPSIQPQSGKWKENQKGASRITFVIKDSETSVASAIATLDGQWILLEQHGKQWFYEFDGFCKPGKHTLTITAKDENENTTVKSFALIR